MSSNRSDKSNNPTFPNSQYQPLLGEDSLNGSTHTRPRRRLRDDIRASLTNLSSALTSRHNTAHASAADAPLDPRTSTPNDSRLRNPDGSYIPESAVATLNPPSITATNPHPSLSSDTQNTDLSRPTQASSRVSNVPSVQQAAGDSLSEKLDNLLKDLNLEREYTRLMRGPLPNVGAKTASELVVERDLQRFLDAFPHPIIPAVKLSDWPNVCFLKLDLENGDCTMSSAQLNFVIKEWQKNITMTSHTIKALVVGNYINEKRKSGRRRDSRRAADAQRTAQPVLFELGNMALQHRDIPFYSSNAARELFTLGSDINGMVQACPTMRLRMLQLEEKIKLATERLAERGG